MDYRDFGDGKRGAGDDGISRRWWELDGDDVARSISAVLSSLREMGSARLTQYVRSARLYGNVSLTGYMGISSTKFATTMNSLPERATYNLVQSCVDAATSKIGKNKPKPMFLTKGGNFKTQRKAKKLTQFMEGVYYENRAHQEGPMVFRDGAVIGDGITHVFAQNGRVKYERALAAEFWVDEMEGMYGEPRQLHRVKPVDRAVLLAKIDEWGVKDAETLKAIVRTAQAHEGEDSRARKNISDMIELRESWHLPSGPEADDGAHAITIDNHVIVSEEWEHEFFPFARFRWCPRVYGYWSQGGAEQIQGTQIELNNLLWTVQRSMRLGGSYKIFIPIGSKVVKEHLNNEFGALVYYTGAQAPSYAVPPMVQPEIYQQIQLLIQRGYDQFGISQLTASSEKPPGLNAAVALREYNDIESDRFRTVGERYEDYFMQLAKLSIAVVKDIAADKGGYLVKVKKGHGFLATIDWNDIDLAEDDYTMQCFPVSSLPNDPAGRFEQIQEWVQAGWYTVDQAKRLMDFPDTEAVNSLANAMEDRLEEVLDAIVDEDEYTPPEPYYNLARAQELALQYLMQGESNKLEPARMSLLRKWLSQCQALQQMAMPPAMPPAGPQAAPMPTPQSELVPNVPGAGVQA